MLRLLCLALLVWTTKGSDDRHGHRQEACAAYEALEPTIYEQLTPLLGGISQSQVDLASKHYAADYLASDSGPKNADLHYNMTAARSLQAEHPEYPWSHPYFVKVVSLDGQLYLPGGRIPPIREGFSFTSQWSSGFLLLDLLNVTDKYGPFPDMEFFVSSGDFQQVTKLSEDGTTFPMFSASGSKHFYDLVLPEATTTQYIKEAAKSFDWSDRTDKVVSRFNKMCHRGGQALQLRGTRNKHPCVREAYHALDQSELNHDGILDVGIHSKGEPGIEPKPIISSDDMARAKFALCIDGGTTADRVPHILRGGQLIMLEDHSPLFSHFYGAMQPWKHYVPIGRDSYDDIFGIARFLVKHDDLARKIAEQGQQFGLKYLTRHASECYTRKMLEVLGSLMTYKPRPLGPKAITLRKAIELAEADRVWMQENPEPEESR